MKVSEDFGKGILIGMLIATVVCMRLAHFDLLGILQWGAIIVAILVAGGVVTAIVVSVVGK